MVYNTLTLYYHKKRFGLHQRSLELFFCKGVDYFFKKQFNTCLDDTVNFKDNLLPHRRTEVLLNRCQKKK